MHTYHYAMHICLGQGALNIFYHNFLNGPDMLPSEKQHTGQCIMCHPGVKYTHVSLLSMLTLSLEVQVGNPSPG